MGNVVKSDKENIFEALLDIAMHGDTQSQIALAQRGIFVDILSESTNPQVQAELAAQGYNIDRFITSYNTDILAGVARSGAHHDTLIKSTSPKIMIEIAKHGNYADELILSGHTDVLIALVGAGKKHDELAKCYQSEVRAEVARTTNDKKILDELAKDTHPNVQYAMAGRKEYAHLYLGNKNELIRALAAMEVDESELYKLAHDPSAHVRASLVRRGFYTEEDALNNIALEDFTASLVMACHEQGIKIPEEAYIAMRPRSERYALIDYGYTPAIRAIASNGTTADKYYARRKLRLMEAEEKARAQFEQAVGF